MDPHQRIVTSAIETLSELVLPHVEDPWAASHLRGTVNLLTTLSARLEHEAAADAADVAMLDELLPRLAALVAAPVAAFATDDVRARRDELERLIVLVHQLPASTEADAAHRLLREHREAHVSRTTPLWRPAANLPVM
ncbi:hypothetical protein [Pseudonocardia xishanensis]|uniref:Uncharacterized protein n=1 Tax=Pseudonocardia xishanensis TaxID=630995 RepID=A0ABP8RPW2_9PSEU